MSRSLLCLVILVVTGSLRVAEALEIEDEIPSQTRVFSSGFGSSPLRNSSPDFVAAGYDLSGAGWMASDWPWSGNGARVHNITMITPLHFVTASHYSRGYFDSGQSLEFVNAASQKITATSAGMTYDVISPTSDVAFGTLKQSFSGTQQVASYRLLDVSATSFAYAGMSAIIYGSSLDGVGPRVAWGEAGQTYGSPEVLPWSNPHRPANNAVGWIGGDSGSPMFLDYINQNGGKELTLAGTAWYPSLAGTLLPFSGSSAYQSVEPTNNFLMQTGYALKWTIYDNPPDSARTAARWTATSPGNLSEVANWSVGAPAGEPGVFASATGISTSVTVDQDAALRGILFAGDGTQQAFSLSGTHTLTLGSSGIRNQSLATQEFFVPIALSSSQNWEAESGELVFHGGVSTGTGNLLVVGGARDTTIHGVISGSGGLAKDDAGTLWILGASTYSGKTFLHNGTVQLGVGGRLGSGDLAFIAPNEVILDLNGQTQTLGEVSSSYGGTGRILLNGANLTINTVGSGTNVYRGTLEGDGLVVKSGTGVWSNAGDDAHTGTTRIDGGALRILTTSALPGSANLVLNGGVLELGAGDYMASLGTGAGQVRFTGSGGFSASGGTRSVNLGGGGATLTWGAGNFVASGSPLLLASAFVDATVDFQNGIHLNSGARRVQVADGSAAIDARLSGDLIGSGELDKMGAGALELTGSNSYTWATMIYGGALIVSSPGALPTANVILTGGVLGLGNGDFTRGLGTGSGQVRFANHGGFSANGTNRSVNIGGAGTTLTWGDTNFLAVGKNLILSDKSSDATVDIRNGLDMAGGVRTVQINNGSADVDARLSGTLRNGGLAVQGQGVLEISGDNTLTGTIQIDGLSSRDGGGLLMTSANALGTGNIALRGGGLLILGNSDFMRTIGGGAGQVSFLSNAAGFGAYGATRTVNIGGDSRQLTWFSGGFLDGSGSKDYAVLTLSSVASNATLMFENPIDLNGSASATFNTQNGSAAIDARLTGNLSNGAFLKQGAGTLEFTGSNTYSGRTILRGGTLRVGSSTSLSVSSNVDIGAESVLEFASGNFAGTLGTGAGQIDFNGSGGFSAAGADRTVTLNGGAALQWGATLGFLENHHQKIIFSSDSADATLILANAISLQGSTGGVGSRIFEVHDGSAAVDARIMGGITTGVNSFWGFHKVGKGTLELSGSNTYTGDTIVSDGVLKVSGLLTASNVTIRGNGEFHYTNGAQLVRHVAVEGGVFRYDSVAAFSGTLDFQGGTIAGTGNLGNTTLLLDAGREIAPGAASLGTGTLQTGAQTWGDGGIYYWEISNLAGTAGSSSGWDLLNISGSLNLLSGTDPIFLVLDSSTPLAGWDAAVGHSWMIATTSTGISGFDASRFTIDSSAFAGKNALMTGQFGLEVSGNNLMLNFVPVPESGVSELLILGLVVTILKGRTCRVRSSRSDQSGRLMAESFPCFPVNRLNRKAFDPRMTADIIFTQVKATAVHHLQ